MIAVAKGIAHVSFPGGGMFLPARTPYDRETLMDYISHTVRRTGRAQVLVDDQRWLVRGRRNQTLGRCTGCDHLLDAACNVAGNAETNEYCVSCAFNVRAEFAPPDYRRHRQAS